MMGVFDERINWGELLVSAGEAEYSCRAGR